MFDYLDVFTRKVIQKMSAKEFYRIAKNKNNDLPLLAKLVNDPQFWVDLSYFHFEAKPLIIENSKNFFIAEYLFSISKFKEAVNYDHPMALYKVIEQEILNTNFVLAMNYARTASKKYGLLGNAIHIYACQTIITAINDQKMILQLVQSALEQLTMMEHSWQNESALQHIKNCSWHEALQQEHGGYVQFINKGREYFLKFSITHN
jgi:hypothetical protein